LSTKRQTQLEDIRSNYGSYYLATNPGYLWVKYQQERIVPALEKIQRGEDRRLMIWMPPGHSKSDLATRNFMPYCLGRNPANNYMVLAYAKDLAADDFGSKIKEKMQGKIHLEAFPSSQISRDSRGKAMFRTIKGGTFYAVGFDGGVAGKRANGISIDDPIKNDEEADSETRMKFLVDTYKSVIKSRLRPRGWIVLCMHRWRIRDFAGRLLEMDGEKKDGGEWTVLRIPAEDPPDSGNFLWAEHYETGPYLSAKKTDDVWASMWQQTPESSKNLLFKKEWLNFYDIPISPHKYNNYMIVDPAGSKEKKSDYTSIHVWAAGQNEKLYLADWVHDRMDPGERAAAIMRLCRRWQPIQLLYEQYGLQNDTYYLNKQMESEAMTDVNGTRIYAIPVGGSSRNHNSPKHQRIKGVRPFFVNGHIYLPRTFEQRGYDGQKVDLTKRFIDEEYSLYTGANSITHEDDLDCMSRLTDEKLLISYYEGEEVAAPKRPTASRGSWESMY
jgi:hypothetical protein